MAPRIPNDVVKERFALGMTDAEIGAGYPGADVTYVFQRRMQLRLLRKPGRQKGQRVARHAPHTVRFKPSAGLPPIDHPSLTESRTKYPKSVAAVAGLPNILVSGFNSRKIGGTVAKGIWRDFPVYTLTLEERATCPESCRHWRSCYGNNMPYAKRIRHGAAFEERLAAELTVLQSRHPRGFAVRLHILGDFYSVDYVRRWTDFLERFPALVVFGFTARWEPSDPIADALLRLVDAEWPRFAIRFSNAPDDELTTVSIEHPKQKPADAIICPAQLGKTESCSTCGLCWHSRRRIAFLQH